MSWTNGRYQARHMYLHNTEEDLEDSAADLATFPVVHDKIEVLGVGVVLTAATGTITTTPAAIEVDKVGIGVSRAKIGNTFTLAEGVQYEQQFQTFDEGEENSPIKGPAEYPTAVKGDNLIIEHTVQGSGGTQTVKPFILYREIEAD